MEIPHLDILTSTDNEDELLDSLNRLSGAELLDLQLVADKITELILIIQVARSEYGTITGEQNDGNTDMQ
jgi:hypothetical protein